jgi:regulatory protein
VSLQARPSARSLKARALQWLSQREQSRAELRRKLLPLALVEDASAAEMGARVEGGAGGGNGSGAERGQADPAARVEALLDWLETNRYLSNERFVESRVHARASRFGNMRIHRELNQHQLALSPDAVQALRETELSRAAAVRERKFGARPTNLAERAKQTRFLAGRGFSREVIGQLLGRATDREEDDGLSHED